jgi:nitrogen fixation/metabolism regulation signal transduction histidine kinase
METAMPYNEKILIVDDERSICDILKALLTAQGYKEIKTCYNGHDALEYLTADTVDLVLLDIAMEEMDGFQVMEKMARQNLDIPVIIMTGDASTASVVEALRKRAYDYLRKPFELGELLTSVKNALNQRMLQKDNNRVKRKLQHSEERFRLLLRNVVLGIFIIKDTHIVYLDPEEGMTSGPFLELFKSGYFNSADIKKIEICCKEILASGMSKDGLEVRFFPDGKASGEENMRWVHCKGSRIEYEGESAVMIALVDVTRVKEMEKVLQLREKMASLGQVATGIAHEIRNPLSGICIFLEGIAENFEAPENREDIRMLIKEAQKATVKIEATVKRVLDFARPGQPHLKETNINIPIREAIELTSTTLRKMDILIETELSDSLPPLYIDALLMEQVVMNLINNAADAMKNNKGEKRIGLVSWYTRNDVFLSVSDSGKGVSEELKNKIFNPFFTTKGDGSGIGLSFCQRVITDHNGTISLLSSEWGGAEFRIKLPVDKRVLSR